MTGDATSENIHDGEPVPRPYAPSWVDLLTGWIERLPGPSWAFYLLLWLVLSLLANAVKWLDGSLSPGAIDPLLVFIVADTVYFLGLIHYLNGAADRALRAFRPALAVSEDEYARLHYQLTTLPALPTLLVSGLGAAVAGLSTLFNPNPPAYAASPAGIVFDAVTYIATMTFLGALLYHTVHQFTTVNRIHATATRLNLFQPDPLYAFSGLAIRTVVGYVVLVDVTYLFMLQFMRDQASDPAVLGLFIFMVLVAVVTFVLPFLGMHGRMEEEKSRLEAEASQRLEVAIAELHRRIDAGDMSNFTELQRGMAALKIEREVLEDIPTWPWEPGTLRLVITAMLLPVIVWLAQRLAGQFVGL